MKTEGAAYLMLLVIFIAGFVLGLITGVFATWVA